MGKLGNRKTKREKLKIILSYNHLQHALEVYSYRSSDMICYCRDQPETKADLPLGLN